MNTPARATTNAPDQHRLAPPRTTTGYALPGDFWLSFHASHWEKIGAVLAQPFAAPIASPEEGFACLVAASDRFRAGDRNVRLEFCIGHAQLLADVGRYLPERADGTPAGYAERVTNLLEGRRFGLVVEDVQAYDATLWLRLRDYLRGLYELTGMPADSAKATVFLGNYDRTPFGLHRGSSGNFMFVVDGAKRMRTWPDAFFTGKEDLTHKLDYAAYNADSIVMDAGPGDVIYWPSDYWHIGESVDGGLSSAVSVALFMDPRLTSDVIARAARMIGTHHAAREHAGPLVVRPTSIGDIASDIDRVTTNATSALQAVSTDASLFRTLRVGLMNKTTGYGFTRPPDALPHVSLADGDTVRGFADYPIIWAHADDDDIICSANGHAFSIAASPKLFALLERINGGTASGVAGLVAEFAGVVEAGGVAFETTADDVRGVLEKLLSLRALIVC